MVRDANFRPRRPHLQMVDPNSFALADVPTITYVIVAGIAFAGGLIGTMSGAGTGLLIAIFIAPVVGVRAVVPVLSVTSIVVNLSRIWVFRHTLDRRLALICIATAAPGAVLGATVYSLLSERAVAVLLGVFLVGMVGVRRLPLDRLVRRGATGASNERRRARVLAAGSFGAGTFVGAVPGAGLLMISVLLGAGMRGMALLGTEASAALAMAMAKTVAFSGYTLLTWKLALVGGLIGLCTIPGTWIARILVERMSLRIHTLFLDLIIVAGGLSFLWRSLAGSGLV